MENFLNKKKYFSISINILKSQHLVCSIKLNKKKGLFIIDTGASNSCIDKEKINFFKLIKNDSEIEVSSAGKEKLKVTPTKKSVFNFKNNKSLELSLMLLDMNSINSSLLDQNGQTVDGILGADFLLKSNSIIDYKTKKIFLKL